MADKTLGECVKTIALELGITPNQLASELQVSYSTLFRIISNESAGSESLINDLVCKKNPKGSITEEELRKAYVLAKSKRNSRNSFAHSSFGAQIEPTLTKIITERLISRGFSVMPVQERFGYIIPDYVIKTDAFDIKNKTMKTWMFEYRPTNPASKDFKNEASAAVRSLLQIIGTCHVFNGNKPDRISLVVTNKEVFEEVLQLTERVMRAEDSISIIYVDIDKSQVVAELCITRANGDLDPSPLMMETEEEILDSFWPDINL